MNANADFVLVIFSVSTILIIIKESIFKENTDFKIYLSIFLILTALISVKQIAIILVGIIYISLILSIIMDKLIHQRKIIKLYKKSQKYQH